MNKKELIEENENIKKLLLAQRDCMGESNIKLNEIEVTCRAYKALIINSDTVDGNVVRDMLKYIERTSII